MISSKGETSWRGVTTRRPHRRRDSKGSWLGDRRRVQSCHIVFSQDQSTKHQNPGKNVLGIIALIWAFLVLFSFS